MIVGSFQPGDSLYCADKATAETANPSTESELQSRSEHATNCSDRHRLFAIEANTLTTTTPRLPTAGDEAARMLTLIWERMD